jgi:hypothetical protein
MSQWEGLSHISWKTKVMFETTNQITIIFPLLLVYSLLTTINHHYWFHPPKNVFQECPKKHPPQRVSIPPGFERVASGHQWLTLRPGARTTIDDHRFNGTPKWLVQWLVDHGNPICNG